MAYEYHKYILLKIKISNDVSLVNTNGLKDLISIIINLKSESLRIKIINLDRS